MMQISGNNTENLRPGIYVGGISITGRGNVNLAPGIYYMQGGGFITGEEKAPPKWQSVVDAQRTFDLPGERALSVARGCPLPRVLPPSPRSHLRARHGATPPTPPRRAPASQGPWRCRRKRESTSPAAQSPTGTARPAWCRPMRSPTSRPRAWRSP